MILCQVRDGELMSNVTNTRMKWAIDCVLFRNEKENKQTMKRLSIEVLQNIERARVDEITDADN